MAEPNSPEFSPLPLGSPSHSPPETPSPSSTPLPSHRHSHAPSHRSSPLNPRRSAVVPPSGDAVARSSDSSGSEGPNISRSSTGALSASGSDGKELDQTTLAVLTGAVGGSFGPFPRSSSYYSDGHAPFLNRDSRASSTSLLTHQESALLFDAPYRLDSPYAASGDSIAGPSSPPLGAGAHRSSSGTRLTALFSEQDASLLWSEENKEPDDYLHNWEPSVEKALDKQVHLWSSRGWFDAGFLVVIILVIVGLFGGWPIWNYAIRGGFPNDNGARQDIGGWGVGGINSSGQVPSIPGLPLLVDEDTPESARSRIGFDGETYNLVFSDEFNTDGRTFWPGDDPFWEAVDLHYCTGTTDYEWYDPDAATTKDGNLEITLSQEPWHNLNFRSAMLQSWNKFCFTGGYIEVRASMPGTPDAMGYWPGVWTLGNLARAGYGATNHGVWPYTYNTCDVGTMPNQTWANGTGPAAALHSGDRDYGGILSYAPGQRLSACTCPGEDHPGPNVNVGRGAPEIDITESQIDYRGTGSTSQSIQFLPSDAGYGWKNTTPDTIIFDDTITFQNIWMGSVNQESASVITLTDDTSFEGAGYLTFAYEYDPGAEGRITWAVNNTPSWEIHASAIGPDADTQIGQRLISEEPMSIILNLGISNSFQTPQWDRIRFPGTLRIDYVRVYQKGDPQVGCDPASHPTSDYINRHLAAYMNPNLTMWTESNNQTWPRNSLSEGGCA